MVALCDPALELHAVQHEVERLVARGGGTAEAASDDRTGRMLTVPCAFDGPDLAEVAAAAGCAPSEVVRLLTEGPLSVAVMGFAPGFAYLDGLPEPLRGVPRRATPRPVVPAGSVALANGYAAVYPTASPGGWQLVGRTGISFFSLEPRPMPRWRRATGSGSSRRRRRRCGGGRRAWLPSGRRRRAPASSSRWRPGAAGRAARTVVGDAVAAIGVPAAGPADPGVVLAGQPAWWAIGRERRRTGDHGRDGSTALPRAVSRRRGGRGTRHPAWTARAEPAGQVLAMLAGQLLEDRPDCGGACGRISPSPAVCSGQRSSVAWPATS